VEIFRDTLFLTASYDKVARVWDLRTGRLVAEMRGHAAPLNAASFSPGGEVATACVDFTARLWKIRVPEPLTLEAPEALTPSSADVAAGGGKAVQAYWQAPIAHILDLPSGRVAATLEGHTAAITTIRFSPDGGKVLSASDDGTARIWSAESGRQIHVLSGHGAGIFSCSFSPDGKKVVTLSQDRTARFWSVETGKEERVYTGLERILWSGFGPDSDRFFLLEEYRGVRIGRISSGEVHPFLPELERRINGADLGPDGQIVLAVRTTKAQVRAIADGSLIATLIQPSRVAQVVYSPDRRWLGTLDSDGMARIWDAVTYEEILNIGRPGKFAERVHFPRTQGRVLVQWYPEGARQRGQEEVVIYPLDVRAAALRAKFAELTPDERENFKVGAAEERREYRRTWAGGDIFGEASPSRP
jgi:WD40 repeat protein